MATFGTVEVLVIGVVIGLTVLALAWGQRAAAIDRWASRRALALTDRSRALVTRYLRSTRRLRAVGFAGGVVLHPVLSAVAPSVGRDLPGPVVLAAIGYGLGAVVAELRLARPSGRREAALVSREPSEYVDSGIRWWLRLLGGLNVSLGIAAGCLSLIGGRRSSGSGFEGGVGASPIVLSSWVTPILIGIVIVVLVEWLQSRIVQAPRPFADDDLVAADDAIRRTSVHAVAGAGIALSFLLAGGALLWMHLELASFAGTGWAAVAELLSGVVPLLVMLGLGTSYVPKEAPSPVPQDGPAGATA